jgi:hypothetical protein
MADFPHCSRDLWRRRRLVLSGSLSTVVPLRRFVSGRCVVEE